MKGICTYHSQCESVHHIQHFYCQKMNSLETHKILIMTVLMDTNDTEADIGIE